MSRPASGRWCLIDAVDGSSPATRSLDRALILGGGGSAGNAWLIGVVAGLFDAGVDLTQADVIVGTSAGSTAAAQITSAVPTRLLSDILSAAPGQRPSGPGPSGGHGPSGGAGSNSGRTAFGQVTNHMETTGDLIAISEDAADMRRRFGAAALATAAASDDEAQTRWRATVASRLPSQDWPERRILITAVDAHTGEPIVFDRSSGIDLADAVAASCANGFGVPPFTIGDRRYLDGAYRRNENADLAVGYARVLVLSPLGGRTRTPLDWGMQLAAQIDELRAQGSQVETIVPDAASLEAFGTNMMDLSTRRPAAQAGSEQGRALADHLTGFWT